VRNASAADMLPIRRALADLQKISPAPWMKLTDLPTAMGNIARQSREGTVKFFGGYMVMFEIGSTWFTPKRCLLEQIVLKVYPWDKTFTIEQVVHAGLDQLASHYGCEATVVGDTQIGLMTPLYTAAGFVPIGTQLFKENTHGRIQESVS
jgi:hypothetical protein